MSENITLQQIPFPQRALWALHRQRPATVWLTGLSGSGKTTLAYRLGRTLLGLGQACAVLDGDNIRHGLSSDLGFSPADRRENIRRVAEVARLMNDAGLVVITALISPFLEHREMARDLIGKDAFLEIWLSADLQTCERRDVRGLYRRARAGEIHGFTGVDAPYENPVSPALVLDTGLESAEQSEARLRALVLERIALVEGDPHRGA